MGKTKEERQPSVVEELEGVYLVMGKEGKPVAVQIDIERYEELLEDFFDVAISEARLKEDKFTPFDDFVDELKEEGII
ncbi:MAG: hypothetical protein AAF388_13845 [Bacteroidota bacterium]